MRDWSWRAAPYDFAGNVPRQFDGLAKISLSEFEPSFGPIDAAEAQFAAQPKRVGAVEQLIGIGL